MRRPRKWLETPSEVSQANITKEIPRRNRSAHHGLVASCEDALQGTYRVETTAGAQWLIAQGADGIFDIIDRPDRIEKGPSDSKILAAVKVYIKRNERMR